MDSHIKFIMHRISQTALETEKRMFAKNFGEISDYSTEKTKIFFLISFSVSSAFPEIIDLENKGYFLTKISIIAINLNQNFLYVLSKEPKQATKCFFWNVCVMDGQRFLFGSVVWFLHSHHGWEGIGFMWKITFEIFIKSLRFETPWVRKKGLYESVCLSVCPSVCPSVCLSVCLSVCRSCAA